MLGWLTVVLQYFFFLIKFLQPQAITTLHQLLVKLLNDICLISEFPFTSEVVLSQTFRS